MSFPPFNRSDVPRSSTPIEKQLTRDLLEEKAKRTELYAAFEQAVHLISVWHAFPQEPEASREWEIYRENAPEMALIRDAIAKGECR